MKKKIIYSFTFILVTAVGVAQTAVTSSKKPAVETLQTQEISNNSTGTQTIVSSSKAPAINPVTDTKSTEQNTPSGTEAEKATNQRKKPE